MSEQQRSVFAAIVGKPNVGKSTLMNKLIGVKVAIMSPKPQTTRNRIMGVITRDAMQYVFVDTPGFHAPKNKLDAHMDQTVRDSVSDLECALFVTWAKDSFDEEEQSLLEELRKSRTPAILVINKIDTLKDRKKGPAACEALTALYPFEAAVCVSAVTGEGLEDLLARLDEQSAQGPHLFDADTLTDMPEKVIVAELVRERLLFNLRDELPHGCAVAVERFKERPDSDLIDIEAEILCEKDSHKGMIIGKKGVMLKKIGSEARLEIEDFLGCRVNLQLWVKVREDWRNRETVLRNLGYG